MSPKTDNSVPIQKRTFRLAAAYLPVSWAQPALKIATLGTGSSPFFQFVIGIFKLVFHSICDALSI
jgi:hypothetical protein